MSITEPPCRVRPVRAFTDNYIWLIDAPQAPGRLVAVDPGDAAPVQAELQRSGESLAAILLTHHHPDHIGGVAALTAGAGGAGIAVIGPEDARIAHLTQPVREGTVADLPELGLRFETLHVPGHTLSHVAYYGHEALFCGDTLFSAGCGRLFEGTARQMSSSLQRLRALPASTRVYCGHEYTAANLRFALEVEPANAAAARYRVSVEAMRSVDTPTLPSNIALEIKINPFLRCGLPEVRGAAERHAGRLLEDEVEVFAVLRAWKDGFR